MNVLGLSFHLPTRTAANRPAIGGWARDLGAFAVAVATFWAVGLATFRGHPPLTGMLDFAAAHARWLPLDAMLLAGGVFMLLRRGGTAAPEAAAAATPSVHARLDAMGHHITHPRSHQSDYEKRLEGAMENGTPVALVLFDIDNFARVNTLHGYGFGDFLKEQVVQRLQIAAVDRSLVRNLHADEFAVAERHVRNAQDAEALATALLHRLADGFGDRETTVDLSFSAGVALAPTHGATPAALMDAARAALISAKQAGGGKLCLYDGNRDGIGRELIQALDSAGGWREFLPFYQPIVDLQSGATAGFEILARWRHPRRGLLLPGAFIDAAEPGDLDRLTQSLLTQAARQTAQLPDELFFSFNLAPGQLAGFITHAAQNWPYPLPAKRLVIEIVETELGDEEALPAVAELAHRHGARLAIDDFGAGASNFTRLAAAPFDLLKISGRLLSADPHAPVLSPALDAILLAGRELDLPMIAEGIISDTQLRTLRAQGCRYGQGALFGMPVAADGLAPLLARGYTAR